MKKLSSIRKGFTLIELLVVIAIIAILTGIVMTNFTSSRTKARDAKKISDIGHIQLALELYFDRCKEYPSHVEPATPPSSPGTVTLDTTYNNGCPVGSGVTFASYLSRIPTPPRDSYDYAVNNLERPTNYVLHVKLENYNEVMKDSAASDPTGAGITCENGSDTVVEYCLTPQ